MKISLISLAVCAPLALPLVARAQSADVPVVAPLPMAPKSAETSDAFVWRFAPPVGSRWTMRTFVRATSDTQMPAMGGQKAESAKFAMMQKMTADYDVLSRDELGATTVRMTLRTMTSDTTIVNNGKTVKSPLTKNADPRAVNGATLTIKQARDGRVWGIVGMRAFQRKLLEANGIGDAAMIDKMLDANPMTNNSEMMKSMSMMSGTLPNSPVRVGESWNYNASLPQPLAFDITGKRTLKSLDSDVAVVAESATYAGGKTPMIMPNAPDTGQINVDYSQMTGSISGVSRVQRSSGLTLESTVNQTIAGSFTTQMPANNGTPAQSLKVPINVTSSARVVMKPR